MLMLILWISHAFSVGPITAGSTRKERIDEINKIVTKNKYKLMSLSEMISNKEYIKLMDLAGGVLHEEVIRELDLTKPEVATLRNWRNTIYAATDKVLERIVRMAEEETKFEYATYNAGKQKEELESQKRNLEYENMQVRQELVDVRKMLDEAQRQTRREQLDIEKMRQKNGADEREIHALYDRQEQLRKELKSANDRRDDSKGELAASQEELKSVSEELEELKSKLKKAEQDLKLEQADQTKKSNALTFACTFAAFAVVVLM